MESVLPCADKYTTYPGECAANQVLLLPCEGDEGMADRKYVVSQFDASTFQVVDQEEHRETCVCSAYENWEDARERAQRIAALLNRDEAGNSNHGLPKAELHMASYIFLTSEGHTFQPNSESEMPDIENLQVIGIAAGQTAQDAFDNLLLENAYLLATNFDQVFCYKIDGDFEGSRKDYSLAEERRKPTSGA
jgi:hypothetical protein